MQGDANWSSIEVTLSSPSLSSSSSPISCSSPNITRAVPSPSPLVGKEPNQPKESVHLPHFLMLLRRKIVLLREGKVLLKRENGSDKSKNSKPIDQHR